MQYIVILGTSGVGKSTLAQQLAHQLHLQHIELDALYWQPDWQPATLHEFRQRVSNALQAAPAGWVIDGNYRTVRDIVWSTADTIIWLNYPIHIIYWRVITRTLKRVISREILWGTNRESVIKSFFSKESIIWWAHTTNKERKRRYSELLTTDNYPHINFIVFQHPRETEAWLTSHPNAQ